jgi:acyl dehydratase
VTQEQVRLFAEATGDHQWIHVDVERARSGPFGAPIAHGFLTLSLYPALKDEILAVEGAGLTVNYGLNKVRFPAPVPVGSRLRLRLEVASAEQRPDGSVEAVFALTFELEGGSKPVCVAESILRFLPPARD